MPQKTRAFSLPESHGPTTERDRNDHSERQRLVHLLGRLLAQEWLRQRGQPVTLVDDANSQPTGGALEQA